MSEQTKESKKLAPVVYALSKASRCFACDCKLEKDTIVKLQQGKDEQEVLCASCAGLKGFVLLAAGNAELTRAAKKLSKNTFVVMQWSELWKCYERRGLFVEQTVLDLAKTQIAASNKKDN